MLIDIHTHTEEPRAPGICRANGSHRPSPERLIEMMDANGIDKAVILSGVSPECKYTTVNPEEVLRIRDRYPDRFIPFCNADPRYLRHGAESDFGPLLSAYKAMGCKGIGEYTPNLPFDDPLNMRFFECAEASGLPLIFHVASRLGGDYGCYDDPGLPRLEKVLRAFPGLVLLGHSPPFWIEISRDVPAGKRNSKPPGKVDPGRVVDLMRAYPNLHGDLSAGSGYHAIHRDPEFGCAFMEEFSERLYFGTDICNDPQETPAVGYFRKLRAERALAEETFENITWRNADRLLGLGLASENKAAGR